MAFPPLPPAWRVVAFLICVPFLAGCNEDDDNTQKVVMTKQVTDLPAWLTPKDKMEPAVWLRSREVGHEVLPSDPEVDRLRRALHQAELRFFEDPRMIANASRFKKLYGEMCQHYLNLRKDGRDRSAAIAQLSASYKAQDDRR